MELINKQKLLEMLNKEFIDALRAFSKSALGLEQAIETIKKQHIIEERKHGYWIKFDCDEQGNSIQCSCCRMKFNLDNQGNYCKYCGAIMDKNSKEVIK